MDRRNTHSHFAHDEVAVEARFALGSWPNDDVRAKAASLPGAKVVRQAMLALRNSISVSAAQATVEFDDSSRSNASKPATLESPVETAGGSTRLATIGTTQSIDPNIPTSIFASGLRKYVPIVSPLRSHLSLLHPTSLSSCPKSSKHFKVSLPTPQNYATECEPAAGRWGRD